MITTYSTAMDAAVLAKLKLSGSEAHQILVCEIEFEEMEFKTLENFVMIRTRIVVMVETQFV